MSDERLGRLLLTARAAAARLSHHVAWQHVDPAAGAADGSCGFCRRELTCRGGRSGGPALDEACTGRRYRPPD